MYREYYVVRTVMGEYVAGCGSSCNFYTTNNFEQASFFKSKEFADNIRNKMDEKYNNTERWFTVTVRVDEYKWNWNGENKYE